jgi:hypothetical protein
MRNWLPKGGMVGSPCAVGPPRAARLASQGRRWIYDIHPSSFNRRARPPSGSDGSTTSNSSFRRRARSPDGGSVWDGPGSGEVSTESCSAARLVPPPHQMSFPGPPSPRSDNFHPQVRHACLSLPPRRCRPFLLGPIPSPLSTLAARSRFYSHLISLFLYRWWLR